MTMPDPPPNRADPTPDEQKGLRRLLAERDALEKGHDLATAERLGLEAEQRLSLPGWVAAGFVAVAGAVIAQETRNGFVFGLCLAMGGTMYIVGRLLIHYVARTHGAQLRPPQPPPRADRPERPEGPPTD